MTTTVKKVAIRLLRAVLNKREYELIPRWELESTPLVNHLRRLFEVYEVDCVIDVGGNMGQYATMLRERVGFRGRIISFEPVQKYVSLLEELSASDDNWTVVGCALGSKQGKATINVTRSPGLNSFLAPRHDQVEGFWKDGDILSSETVEVSTLDSALATLEHDCSKVGTYLKLDTQGFDLEVLSGAARSLPLIRGLQTEASVRPIYEAMPAYSATLSAIKDAGFSLSGMFPVTSDTVCRLVEFDCVAVNSIAAEALATTPRI